MASIFDDLIPNKTTNTTKPKTGYTGSMFADLIPDKKQTKKELLASSFDYKPAQEIAGMNYQEKEAYKSKLSKDIGSFMPFSSSKQAIPTQSRPIQEDLEKLAPEYQEQYKTKYRTLLDEEMKKTTYTERLAAAVPNYFLAEKFQDTKSPVIRALNFDEIQMLTPQERTQYKELLKKDIFDGLADTTLTPENKKVLQTEEGTKEFSLGNPLKLSLELTAMMYGVKTPKAVKDFLNTPIGKEAMLSVAENTENLPVKLLAKFQEQTKIPIMGNVNVGAEYEKILNAWVEAGTNPDSPFWKRFLFTTQSTLPQTLLGVMLNISGNYILPGAGNALSGAYWMALSGSDQIQRRGKIYSVNNLMIDVALDSFLGNSIEGIFKRGAKDILIKEMGKNGVIEGGTEVSQTLLKYANDWANAPNERAKKEILAQAVNYVKSGDMFMEFASSFASGAIIGGAGNVVDTKIRPQSKINVGTDIGDTITPDDGGVMPPKATEMARETIEIPQLVETSVKAETTPTEAKTYYRGGSKEGNIEGQGGLYLTSSKEGAATFGKEVYEQKVTLKDSEILDLVGKKDEMKSMLKEAGLDPMLDFFGSLPHNFSSPEAKRTFVEYVKNNTDYKAVRFDDVDFGRRTAMDSLVVFDKSQMETKEAKTTPQKDFTQGLMEEARKYKSAEEFVKKHSKLYHGVKEGRKFTGFRPAGANMTFGVEGVYLTSDKNTAEMFGNVHDAYIDKNIKLKDLSKEKMSLGGIDFQNEVKKAKSEGFDGVKTRLQTLIFDANKIKTKSQLTDIWNKAQEQIIEKPKGKETKLGKSIALKAIEDKLIKTYDGVAEYTPTTIEKQAKMSNDLLQNDMEGVRQIFRGERDLPKGLNSSALIVATETFLKQNNIAEAPQILAEMMNSNLVSESSVAGQTLRLLAEREQDSATAKLQEIKKHREEKAKKATKKTVASVANDASLFMSQDNLNQLEKNLDNFLDSIKC